jgi:hypothetical protein
VKTLQKRCAAQRKEKGLDAYGQTAGLAKDRGPWLRPFWCLAAELQVPDGRACRLSAIVLKRRFRLATGTCP